MAEIALSDAARKRLAPVLDKFEPSEASSYQARVAVERERVPVPWLPYLALVQIIGCRDLGTAEKTMWQVPFRYDRIEAMLTYEKFGLRLHLDVPHDGDDSQKLAAAIVGKLNAIVKTIEKETLQNLAKQKLNNGEVTLLNQQHSPGCTTSRRRDRWRPVCPGNRRRGSAPCSTSAHRPQARR
jgi:hypothetical protein